MNSIKFYRDSQSKNNLVTEAEYIKEPIGVAFIEKEKIKRNFDFLVKNRYTSDIEEIVFTKKSYDTI